MGGKTQQLISLGSVQEADQSISAEVLEELRARKLSKLLAPHTKILLLVCSAPGMAGLCGHSFSCATNR